MNSRDTIIARLIKSNRRVDIGFEGTSHTYIGFLGSSNGVRSVIRAFVSGMYHGLALRSNWSRLGDIASIKNGRISRDIELECHAHVEEASGCVSLDRIVIQWSIKLTFSTYVRTYIVIRSILFLRPVFFTPSFRIKCAQISNSILILILPLYWLLLILSCGPLFPFRRRLDEIRIGYGIQRYSLGHQRNEMILRDKCRLYCYHSSSNREDLRIPTGITSPLFGV